MVLLAPSCAAPEKVEGFGVKIEWGQDGSYKGSGPGCIQFTDSSGNPVGGPQPLSPGGAIPEGAVGFHGADCPVRELSQGDGAGDGPAGGPDRGNAVGTGPHPTGWLVDEIEVAGGIVGDLSHVLHYRSRVRGLEQSAQLVASQYAASVHLDPSLAPEPPASLEILALVGVQVEDVAATEGLVYGLAEAPFSHWSVAVNGTPLASGPQIQLPSGLWMAWTSVPLSIVDLDPGAINEVVADFDHPSHAETAEFTYTFAEE